MRRSLREELYSMTRRLPAVRAPSTATRRFTMERDFERDLNERAWSDEAFRKELLNDPRKAIEKLTGQPLPKGVRVTLVEDTADTIHFVLRQKPVTPSGELSDEALDKVAGGYASFEMNKHLNRI
jgi:hypothetical protein